MNKNKQTNSSNKNQTNSPQTDVSMATLLKKKAIHQGWNILWWWYPYLYQSTCIPSHEQRETSKWYVKYVVTAHKYAPVWIVPNGKSNTRSSILNIANMVVGSDKDNFLLLDTTAVPPFHDLISAQNVCFRIFVKLINYLSFTYLGDSPYS